MYVHHIYTLTHPSTPLNTLYTPYIHHYIHPKGVSYGSAEENMCDFHCAPGSLCNTMVQWPSHGCTAQYIEYPTDLTLGIYIAAGTIFGFFACMGLFFVTADWRKNGGFVELIMYSFRVARNNWKDNSICLFGCFVPAGYTVVRNWVYVEMIAAIETLSKNTLTLQSVGLDDLNAAKDKMLKESMILVGVLALTFIFKVRVVCVCCDAHCCDVCWVAGRVVVLQPSTAFNSLLQPPTA